MVGACGCDPPLEGAFRYLADQTSNTGMSASSPTQSEFDEMRIPSSSETGWEEVWKCGKLRVRRAGTCAVSGFILGRSKRSSGNKRNTCFDGALTWPLAVTSQSDALT